MKIFFILIFFPIVSSSQNLLLNSSFEEENICSEYKVDCAPEAWIYTVPSFIYYLKDKNAAHTGESLFLGNEAIISAPIFSAFTSFPFPAPG